MLDIIKDLSGWGETAPPWASQFLYSKEPSRRMTLICKLTNPELHLLCLACAPQEAIPLCPIIPGPGTRYPNSPKPTQILQTGQS